MLNKRCSLQKRGKALAFFLVSLLVLPGSALATNGYWAHGYGAKSKAMAGTGTALPLDGMDAAANPAKMVHLGNRVDVGVAAFMPDRGFKANDDAGIGFPTIAPGSNESDNDVFFIPHFACNRMLDSRSSLGVSIGANGGMNTEYDFAVFAPFNNPGGVASSPTGMDYKQIFVGVTYARKVAEHHSFGVTPILAVQALKVTGLEPFQPFSAAPDYVSNNGDDYSYGGGLRFGWLTEVTDTLSLGFSYQSRMWMSDFNDYRGLFAEQGGLDIPPNLTAGLAWHVTEKVTFLFDIQHIMFEDVKSIANSADLVFQPGSILLGTDDGLGFGWKDMTIAKFGLQWQWRDDVTFRAGYSVADEIIPDSQALFNVLAPAVVREHYTFGLTKAFKTMELNMAFMYAPQEKLTGTNPNTGPQTGSLEMDQIEIQFSVGFIF